MKLHAICIFAAVLTSALLLESTSAQCDELSIGRWVMDNLALQCQGQLGLFNTVPTPQTMQRWRDAVNYVCTTDTCGGALYRYLLANCNSLPSNITGTVQNISLAVGLQNRCAVNGTSTGDRCYCGDTVASVSGMAGDNSFICRRNISLDNLIPCAALQNPNVTQCPADCRTALQAIGGYLGCCFNNIYNTSGSPLNGVLLGAENPGLWMLCGVPIPDGRCPNVLSDTALPTTTTMTPTTAGSDATAASKMVIGLLLALTLIKALF